MIDVWGRCVDDLEECDDETNVVSDKVETRRPLDTTRVNSRNSQATECNIHLAIHILW